MSDDKPEASENQTEDTPDEAGEVTTTDARETEAEGSELDMAAKPAPDEPRDSTHSHSPGHGHGNPGHGHDHGLAHTTPVSLLFIILGILLFLTVATVAVTSIDLGAQGNLIVAMVIATVKAALVCTFFMHLLWDKKFNTILFLTSVLFLILFLSMATTDRGEYQHDVDTYRAIQIAPK
ncbi:MAG TPA: cytochrome C oxidase subunit IV family protein [Polyangiaceae bacterium]|nr:cytochrome C oxidase subunit IV family protein [Polyangiaceae bacterium]